MPKKEPELEFQVFWLLVQCSLHRLRTVTVLPRSGSMMALYILVMRHHSLPLFRCFAAGWRAQSYTVQKPHISLEVNDIDIFCLIWRCCIQSYSKSDLVSFSISLIILTLAGACVMPEKQSEEEELASERWVWYTMKNSAVQLSFIFSPRLRLPPRKLGNIFKHMDQIRPRYVFITTLSG